MRDLPRTLIVGVDSFVGRHLLAAYRQVYPDTIGTTRRWERTGPGLAYLDLANPTLDEIPLAAGRYQAAIIAAAVSKPDLCHRDPPGTWQVNVTGTLRLIELLQDRGIVPIFLSSDYVFDGTAPDGCPDDAPRCPNTEYGRQKATVEESQPPLVLRLSKIYGLEPGDGSFLDEIVSQLRAGRTYAAAFDQRFSPTFVGDLAPAMMEVQRRGLTGIVNLCAEKSWSRLDIALTVARTIGAPEDLVKRISLDELPGPVRRPKNTSIIPRRLAAETSVRFTPLLDVLPRLGTLLGRNVT